ncbi:unnamed protein product [Lactuca saligna]|uniref:Leucine-rich repeat-containing N-terminal plant-type domain-containing protein n=1 Tax=Lactuca saligna TaxID=75948 RepID=A0AA36E781_LACSI|nr:unnamed protein product [Lactuca saligna]
MRKLWLGKFLLFFTFATTNLASGCYEQEREVLLRFKRSLVSDPSGRLSSWSGNNCCQWQGVGCDNATGHVTTLDLGSPYLGFAEMLRVNKLKSSLAELTQLRFLNLSSMGFSGIVPHFIGNLSNLCVLDLSYMDLVVDDFTWVTSLLSLKHLDLSGLSVVKAPNFNKVLLYMISSLQVLLLSGCELSNPHFYGMHLESNLTLSPIHTLDLSSNFLQDEFPLFLQNLTSLQVLDLSFNELNSSIPVMKKVVDLNLEQNGFTGIQDTRVWRLCQLQRLDLSFNSMEGGFMGPSTNGNGSECAQFSLETLNLYENKLVGEIPTSLGRLTALRELNLGWNELTGTIPEALGNLTSLRELDISNNKLTGSIPTSFGNLLLLKNLYLSSNLLNGTIPFSLGRLSNLQNLYLEFNWLSGLPLSLGNLSELRSLHAPYNFLQGPLPTIGKLSKLSSLDISGNSLSDVVTEAHFSNTSMLKYFDATSNYKLSFKFSPDWKPPFQIGKLELGSCKIESDFPQWIRAQTSLEYLDLSNTSIYGPLPDWLSELPIMMTLDLSHNFLNGPLTNLPSNQTIQDLTITYPGQSRLLLLRNNLFNGSIPKSLCNITKLAILDLSRNTLSGTFPDCLGSIRNLYVLTLSSNQLSGVIPSSVGNLGSSLDWLALNNNSFQGELPKTLANCRNLVLLDLGENRFSGSVPKWIGENMKELVFLRLHKNSFTGPIPVELCERSTLQIMDLGENKLTGTIPRCFQNLSGMITGGDNSISFSGSYELSLSQVMKGVVLEYTTTLRYVVNIDLSSNKLVGEIPKELSLLLGLHGLNLSNNHLTGRIPDRIGDMNSLESLDLSINQLSGVIPQSLSALTFLSYLNLSHNNLSGRIPTGSQLQTLTDPSIYAANSELCGNPLPIKCNHDDDVPGTGRNSEEDEDDDSDEKIWIYGATGGFTTGFMGIVAILVLKNRWRLVFFKFVGYYIRRKL